MANKLYPPYLDGTLPAFAGNVLTVPFTHNAIISNADVSNMQLIIYDLFGSKQAELEAQNFNFYDSVAYFNIPKDVLTIGIYYKVQLAYIDKTGQVGYYSTVAVVKYTSQPVITIDGLHSDAENATLTEYVGVFAQTEDITEKLYSSYMTLYDENNNIIIETEPIIHSYSYDDNSNVQSERVVFNYAFQPQTVYYIVFQTTSLNGLKTSSPQYRLILEDFFDFGYTGNIIATNNSEEGYVELKLNLTLSDLVGKFILSRTDVATYEKIILSRFFIQNETTGSWNYKDYTAASGKEYIYSLQQYNSNGIYSKPLETEQPIKTDFEHTYLTDGEKTLKIKYNSQLKGLKSVIQEKKIETLGGTHPFIFRNGTINYKEFSISGLLSKMSDDEGYFSGGAIENYNFSGQYYCRENILEEREWRDAVLDWLNNGKPKLYKSATEGNYIVRLLSNSLDPFENTNRLLYTFNSSAVEIDKINSDTLEKYGFITPKEAENSGRYTWISHVAPLDNSVKTISGQEIKDIRFVDFKPFDKIWIKCNGSNNYTEIIIGATGAYQIYDLDIIGIELRGPYSSGLVSYRDTISYNPFELIMGITRYAPVFMSALGGSNDMKFALPYVYREGGVKIYISNIAFIQIEKDPYYINNNNSPKHEYCFTTKGSNVVNMRDKIIYTIPNPDETMLKTLQIGPGLKANLAFSYAEVKYENEDLEQFQSLKANCLQDENENTKTAYSNYLEELEEDLAAKGVIKRNVLLT